MSAELAVEEPRAGHVAQAARTLGLKVELEEDARPPGHAYTHKGRVLVLKAEGKKEALLKQIARRL